MTKKRAEKAGMPPVSRNTIIRGRYCSYTQLSSGSTTIQFTPQNLGSGGQGVLKDMADVFQLYRWRHLKFTVTEGSWGNQLSAGKYSTGYVASLYHELPDTLPTTDHTQAMENPVSIFMDGCWAAANAAAPTGYVGPLQAGYPQKKFGVGPKWLLGDEPVKWWRTQTSTAGTPTTNKWQEVQCTLLFVAEDTSYGSGLQFTWWCDYECEFSGPVDPRNTPLPTLAERRITEASDDELRKIQELVLNERTQRLDSATRAIDLVPTPGQ